MGRGGLRTDRLIPIYVSKSAIIICIFHLKMYHYFSQV